MARDALTATETVTMVSGLLRAADLNVFDLAMWFRRSDMSDVSLGRYEALRERERLVVDIGGIEVGVFFVGEAVHAWLNRCPHMGGPVCQGKLMPRTLEATAPDGRVSASLSRRPIGTSFAPGMATSSTC